VVTLGGDRAQRDVFRDTLLEACFKSGDMDRAERLLAERIARRPDHFWKSRTAMGVGTAAR
jgi:pentatricopeptide repeat protein